MLSEENRSKIIKSGLYSHKPEIKYRGTLYKDNLYHCMNWTFTPMEHDGREVYMVDTYFNSTRIKLTDENFNEFKLIFDFNKVLLIGNPLEYDDEDIYHVAIDSGGWYCGGTYFKKKDAKVSKEKLIKIYESKLKSAKSDVKRYSEELKEIKNDTHWKLID